MLSWWRRGTARAQAGVGQHLARLVVAPPGVPQAGLASRTLAGGGRSLVTAPSGAVRPFTTERLRESLQRLGIRFLTDEDGDLLALWEGHSVLFAAEGPDRRTLVVRARADAMVPPEWADRAYTAVNEWNRTRRFLKTFVGEPADGGRLPVYGELQVHLGPGIHDALLDELVDCAASVAGSWVDWPRGDGGLL